MNLRKDQTILIWASVVALALPYAPYLRYLVLPFRYFKTQIHELCHALTCILTGGKVDYILLYGEGGGLTVPVDIGNTLLVVPAGYVGSAIVGGILIFGSRTVKSATMMLWLAAGILTLSMIFFVRGDVVGMIIGIAWILAIASAAIWMKGDTKIFAVQFLGIQQCLTAVSSVMYLMKMVAFDLGHNDAVIMEKATNVPAMVWAVLWLIISLVMIFVGIWFAWRFKPRSKTANAK